VGQVVKEHDVFKEIVGRGWAFQLRRGVVVGPQGGLALTSELTELDQAIDIILNTSPGERIMRPTFGCRLHELIFAPNNSQTMAQARRFVEEALGMWEPRIKVMEVNVQAVDMETDLSAAQQKSQRNCLLLEIKYQVKATHDQRSLVHPFYLIPED
jgi:uncharacterized protein